MGDVPEQLGAAVSDVVASAVEQAQEAAKAAPEKVKKKIEAKTGSALKRLSFAVGESFSSAGEGLDAFVKMGLKMLAGAGESILEFMGIKELISRGEEETEEQKAAREGRAKQRRKDMVDTAKKKVSGLKGADGMIDVMKKNSSLEQALVAGCEANGVCPAMPMAIFWAESKGIASAINPKSNAKGIGQFMPGTWANFVKKEGIYWSLDPCVRHDEPPDPCQIDVNKHRLDGPAGVIAACWLIKQNAGKMNVNFDPMNPEHTAFSYLYYHNGPTAAVEMWNWKVNGGPPGKVPGEPDEYYRQTYGTNYEAYANDILALADNVQATAMVLYSKGAKWQGPPQDGEAMV